MSSSDASKSQDLNNVDLLLADLPKDSLAHKLVTSYASASPEEAKSIISKLLEEHFRRQLSNKPESERVPD